MGHKKYYPHSHYLAKKAKSAYKATKKATVKTLETVGDAVLDTAEASVNFVKDPSISNLVSIVTAPLGMNSCWHYADKVTISRNNIFFVPKGMVGRGATKPSGDPDGLVTTYAEASAIPYRLKPNLNVKESYNERVTVGGKRVERKVNKRDYAVKVEWYNPSTKKWSSPSINPPYSPKTDKEGKWVLYFRFPRQLDPNSDRAEIQKGIEKGMGDQSWNKTKYCYPYPKFNSKTGQIEKAYNLLGVEWR